MLPLLLHAAVPLTHSIYRIAGKFSGIHELAKMKISRRKRSWLNLANLHGCGHWHSACACAHVYVDRNEKKMSTYTVETIVRGYHVYQNVWDAAVGQVLPCQRERGNVHEPYAVAIVDRARGVIVGHVPRAVSSVRYLFLGNSGTILCLVTGTRRYSRDLPQSGLEIPCKLAKLG